MKSKESLGDFTNQQKLQTKERGEVDEQLIEGGAVRGDDGKLELTAEQVENLKLIMQDERAKQKYYEEGENNDRININGIEITVGWSPGFGEYALFFPQIKMLSDEAKKHDLFLPFIGFGKDHTAAKDMFDKAKELAGQEDINVYELLAKLGKE